MVLKINIYTLEKQFCSNKTIAEVILPTTTGQIGILPGHAPLITTVETGLLKMKLENKWTLFLLNGEGIAQVSENKVKVLISKLEELLKSDLDPKEVKKELEEALLGMTNAETTKARLNAAVILKKATARFEAVEYFKNIKDESFKNEGNK